MDEEKIGEIISRYEKYAKKSGFMLNPDRKAVENLVRGLLLNEKKHGSKYCPCRRVSGDKEEDKKNICPCVWHKDEIRKMGHCHCMLFVE
ncbi:MAG: ferredoxin:thioredoxin reductase [Candidatus Aenigmarchaeota archaeon]|nr:ferredoxin:thioredoxin reductase [Candidatus Aenigmarchaeota archaeon]